MAVTGVTAVTGGIAGVAADVIAADGELNDSRVEAARGFAVDGAGLVVVGTETDRFIEEHREMSERQSPTATEVASVEVGTERKTDGHRGSFDRHSCITRAREAQQPRCIP
jgi:hypothetical protein